MIPSNPGTYILILHLSQAQSVGIGMLGAVYLLAGFYAYVGSAFGAGGLVGRLGHHLKMSERPHWHIDYLRRAAVIEQIWFLEFGERREHAWAALLAEMPNSSVPVPRFGASDCACQSHLFYFQLVPQLRDFHRLTTRDYPNDPAVRCVSVEAGGGVRRSGL